ncbi:MAG: Coenzyme F420 hydrogenase/dehydrogenase, beta subunit C-terminal domain [Paludibacter sp.]|nr:Coenzyme F420 hydrogenase/dehydrogenase, beta subunit C-terminal domain [Paludibacter sp.]
MIDIIRKEDCTGCSACFDICPTKAIRLETDIEGFWYPKVDIDLCVDCDLCDDTCAELHMDELKNDGTTTTPTVFAARYNDTEIRIKSTSGGIFSALAEYMYQQGGYVGGAIYTDTFSVKHIISNNPEDLNKIRGSKHFESETVGLFLETEKLLKQGEKVLICATPCQIASLRLFLRKEYDNLFTVDFICLGINSPKVFQKHLESLEKSFGAKAFSVQGKNKDMGWRSLAYKIKFANGKIYLRPGREDPFTRGFIHAHINCRPTCYECKYKGFPRISDITLGDFWGIEKIDATIDDNLGTSLVLLNSAKGKKLFESINEVIEKRELNLSDALPGNQALLHPLSLPTINREKFYQDLDKLPFNEVVKKYYPNEGGLKNKLKKGLVFLKDKISQMGYSPKTYLQFLWINLLRKNTYSDLLRLKLIFPTRHTILDIHKQAIISNKGSILLGYKRIRGSKLETRLAVEENATMSIDRGNVSVYYGTDILVFKDAHLTFKGTATINQHVQIICMDNITIGDDVLISRDVVIRDNDGGHEILTEGYKKTAPVVIGNHVWIGQGALIMKGVTIGDGAIIGAGAWVGTNVKPNSLVMGDPARTVQKDIEWRQ